MMEEDSAHQSSSTQDETTVKREEDAANSSSVLAEDVTDSLKDAISVTEREDDAISSVFSQDNPHTPRQKTSRLKVDSDVLCGVNREDGMDDRSPGKEGKDLGPEEDEIVTDKREERLKVEGDEGASVKGESDTISLASALIPVDDLLTAQKEIRRSKERDDEVSVGKLSLDVQAQYFPLSGGKVALLALS
ncbi:hypothetical protein A0H81_07363 [Grifola frondosa]|uniref:Uncharacterized protein n=1 Tax=Grifola frondosa TaxID=5627 RepID=A0A1C7M6I1_GRIFR|nr:hypothetical protein A0H81_07363 [Grifola frondosa]